MVKLKRLIREGVESQIGITIDDIVAAASSKWGDRTAQITLGVIEDFYYSEEPEKQRYAREYIDLLNKVLVVVGQIVGNLKIPYVNFKLVKSYLLGMTEFRTKVEEFFPFPLYIAATRNADGDWAEIGVMVDSSGKVLEVHEGNDESSPETIALANKLVNPSGKKVRVYGHHSTKLCYKIEETGYLPPNLYVSPRKELSPNWGHAGIDLNDDRSMFTGIIDLNDVNQEDEVAWKTVGNTKIDKFKWL